MYEIIRINLFLLRAIFPFKSRIRSAIMEEDRLNFIVEDMLICWSMKGPEYIHMLLCRRTQLYSSRFINWLGCSQIESQCSWNIMQNSMFTCWPRAAREGVLQI
jgi:hypothetical protein